MPNYFARIENGIVSEIVTVDDNTPSLASRYHAALLDHFVELHGADQYTVKAGWNYDGSGFYNVSTPAFIPQKQLVKVSAFRERMEEAGKWENLVDILKNDISKLLKILTTDSGINPDDAEIRSLISQAGADPNEILKE